MPLYGELEISKSVGLSAAVAPAFVGASTLAYASGNSINLVDINSQKAAATSLNPGVFPKAIHCERRITALAASKTASAIAYYEERSGAVRVSKYPLSSSAPAPVTLRDPEFNDTHVTWLAFSYCGKYLAVLGDLPTYRVAVWEWRTATLVTSALNEAPAAQISFNPLDWRALCTSGAGGGVKFWKVEAAYKYQTLRAIPSTDPVLSLADGPLSFSQDGFSADDDDTLRDIPRLSAHRHVWRADGSVLVTDESERRIFVFNAETGTSSTVLEAASTNAEDESIRAGDFGALVYAKGNIVAAGKNGHLVFLKEDTFKVSRRVDVSKAKIRFLALSPDFRDVAITTSDGRIFAFKEASASVELIHDNHSAGMTALTIPRLANTLICGKSSGEVSLWDVETKLARTNKFDTQASITAVEASPLSPSLIAVGSTLGVVRLFGNAASPTPKLLLRQRTHVTPVTALKYDPTGRILASTAHKDDRVYFYAAFDGFAPLGFTQLGGPVTCIQWLKDEETADSLSLFVLASENTTSKVYRFKFPSSSAPLAFSEDSQLLTRPTLYKCDQLYFKLFVSPKSAGSSGREGVFLSSRSEKRIRTFHFPPNIDSETSELSLINSGSELLEHEKPGCTLMSNTLRDWLVSHAPDGSIVFRHLLEVEKSIEVRGHSSWQGGVHTLVQSRDSRLVVSLGHDGILKTYEWKTTPAGKKALSDAATICETLAAAQQSDSITLEARLQQSSLPVVNDDPDSDDEKRVFEKMQESESQDLAKLAAETKQHHDFMLERITAIKSKIADAIARNDAAPELEKIDSDEFVVDREERDRLTAEADARVREARLEIERGNLKKRVEFRILRNEFWDAMEVHGQSVLSFKPDTLTGRRIEVANYPIRKQSDEERRIPKKLKLLRQAQILATKEIQDVFKKQDTTAAKDLQAFPEEENETPSTPAADESRDTQTQIQTLLYDPFNLNTNEKRRIQASLLRDRIEEIKTAFNEKFVKMSRAKLDEINKIEEKNERVKDIMDELEILEDVFAPVLAADETPEKIIEVRDDEVTAEKFISQEEMKKLEQKRRIEEEKRRLAQEDNARERALNHMMYGKLEDRSEQDDREVLVKAEWMSKPVAEMSEEEKKLLKEYEKKLAILKEEQEKQRKALETELRKLQTTTQDLCAAFDASLREFFNEKLRTDQLIYQHELRIIKLAQATMNTEEDEEREQTILVKMEKLRGDRQKYSGELGDVKKDLENVKEEYDQVLKKDREIEKQFKKELHSDAAAEHLFRLFRVRKAATGPQLVAGGIAAPSARPSEVTNPFDTLDPYQTKAASNADPAGQPDAIAKLTVQADCPEGVSAEAFQRMVEFRDQKIASERELRLAQANLNEVQTVVSNVTEKTDVIRRELDTLSAQLTEFMEYKFHSTYNLESLFSIKQGQVEVPQAPVVTDYSDSVLIHKSVVERINEIIIARGKAKVDALNEMKEYRKGTHSLEWENKLLDFQAEDLVTKTRDIQLLRVTKHMQEYLRSGDEHKITSEVAALEKRSEYGGKVHQHKVEEKERVHDTIRKKISAKTTENAQLDAELLKLDSKLTDRKAIYDSHVKGHPNATKEMADRKLRTIYQRRKYIDLARSQAQDISILREEVERLRLRTYPAFSSMPKTAF